MKRTMVILLAFSCFVIYSQNPISFIGYSDQLLPFQFKIGMISITNNKNVFKKNIELSDVNLNIKYLKIVPPDLYLYNSTTQLYVNFNKSNGLYYRTNAASFPKYSAQGRIIDSFNPYGASNMKEALTSGILGFLGFGTLEFYPPPVALPPPSD